MSREVVYINNNKEVIMNYKLHYDKLIERAKDRQLDCYTESHHIIPRSINGTNDKDNLVNLTAREHFIAHILLVKIYPKEYGLIKAVNMMTIGQDERKVHNRMYGWLKEKFSKEMSRNQSGTGNSQFGTIWIHNLEEKVSKKIKKEELLIYEHSGWLKGRLKKDKKIGHIRTCKNCKARTITTRSYCNICHDERINKVNELNKDRIKRKLKPINESKLNIKLIEDLGIKISISGNRYRKGLFECPECHKHFETTVKLAQKIKSCKKCSHLMKN